MQFLYFLAKRAESQGWDKFKAFWVVLNVLLRVSAAQLSWDILTWGSQLNLEKVRIICDKQTLFRY